VVLPELGLPAKAILILDFLLILILSDINYSLKYWLAIANRMPKK